MFQYDYLRPTTIQEACEFLAAHKGSAAIVAGGTDLLVQVREQDKKWAGMKVVIDITHIKELDYIKQEGDVIKIGPLSTHHKIARNPILQKEADFLCKGSQSVGSPQMRNRGTVGGSIGNASPASDPVPALIALEAEIDLQSVRGKRTVPLKSVYVKPYVTTIEKDEMITEIRFNKLPEGTKTSFVKLGRRKALAISRLNVAVALTFDHNGKVTQARISPGCIFSTPDRVTAAEEVMLSDLPFEEAAIEAGKKVSEEMITRTGVRWSTEYKKPAIESLVTRAVCLAKES